MSIFICFICARQPVAGRKGGGGLSCFEVRIPQSVQFFVHFHAVFGKNYAK